ncbi:Unknown protein sequence [Pseudomonas syringae pv. cilantro]|uniref:Uncharacterized protein n=1 Tax=Pseudomonas syringae pv. cilantro TaxID=81035 RepID=A0A0N0GC89_PSESX|nr:Unknown protein sequence [Pseudomonas syringae pv. cilantro]
MACYCFLMSQLSTQGVRLSTAETLGLYAEWRQNDNHENSQ